MIDRLNMLAIALIVASCNPTSTGGYGGTCGEVDEDPIARAGAVYHVSEADPGLEHLVGALVDYAPIDSSEHLLITYVHDDVAYAVAYDLVNLP